MRRDIGLDCKSLITNVTSIGAFARVNTFVCVQARLLSEPLRADRALEGPLPGVSPHVHLGEENRTGVSDASRVYTLRPCGF